MTSTDHLRPPSTFDPTAAAAKDWLHVNVFDHRSGAVGLVNVSVHGAAWDPRSRAVGTALVHDPVDGWRGAVDVGPAEGVLASPDALALPRVAVTGDGSGPVLASVRMREEGLSLDLTGEPSGPAVTVPGPAPVGGGWIGWYARPRLRLSGTLGVGGRTTALAGASGYFDHNWGRWHWGDDVGWDWGALLAPDDGPSLVLSRLTDRSHRRHGPATVEVRAAGVRRRFSGAGVTVATSGVLDAPPLRLPGALAALHADRSAPRLPARTHIGCHAGPDHVEVTFTARAAAQLVLGDPVRRGYGFLHELVGDFLVHGVLGGRDVSGGGLGVVERAE